MLCQRKIFEDVLSHVFEFVFFITPSHCLERVDRCWLLLDLTIVLFGLDFWLIFIFFRDLAIFSLDRLLSRRFVLTVIGKLKRLEVVHLVHIELDVGRKMLALHVRKRRQDDLAVLVLFVVSLGG